MRIRITIDDEEANEPEAINTDTPFSLFVYTDDEDGTPSDRPLEVAGEGAVLGNNITEMLGQLIIAWTGNAVLDQHGKSLPRTGKEWQVLQAALGLKTLGGLAGAARMCGSCTHDDRNVRPTGGVCDQCDQPATSFWPKLNPPVQLCDNCTHDAFRSGWEPGA